jgi:hypothetical protein
LNIGVEMDVIGCSRRREPPSRRSDFSNMSGIEQRRG